MRLLNLCGPYEASLLGRAAEAVDETEAFARRWTSCAAPLLGSRDLERTAAEDVGEVPPGERSNRSARARTLFDVGGGERVAPEDDAGPEADLGVAFGVDREPFVTGWRGRVAGISRPCCGEAGASSSEAWAWAAVV